MSQFVVKSAEFGASQEGQCCEMFEGRARALLLAPNFVIQSHRQNATDSVANNRYNRTLIERFERLSGGFAMATPIQIGIGFQAETASADTAHG